MNQVKKCGISMCKGTVASGSMVRTLTRHPGEMSVARARGMEAGRKVERVGYMVAVGRGVRGRQEPSHSGRVVLSAKVGALSLTRDQRASVQALRKGRHAHIYKQATGCILRRSVRRPCWGPGGRPGTGTSVLVVKQSG